MDFRSIIGILKGDRQGHDFHGNQWVTENGSFVAKPPKGNGRKAPAPQPAPEPRVPSAPSAPRVSSPKVEEAVSRLAQSLNHPLGDQPATPTPPNDTSKPFSADVQTALPSKGDNAVVLKTTEIASEEGRAEFRGGACNNGFQIVTMKDGTQANIKSVSGADAIGWDNVTAEYGAQSEVLAGAIAKVLNVSVRGSDFITPTRIIQPNLDGETAATYSGAKTSQIREDLKGIRFFDQLTGNPDRMGRDGELVNIGNLMYTTDGRAVGIDNGLILLPEGTHAYDSSRTPELPDISLLGNLSNEDIGRIDSGLRGLKPMFDSLGRGQSFDYMMSRWNDGVMSRLSKAVGDSPSRTILFYSPNSKDAGDYSGALILKGSEIVHAEGCVNSFLPTLKAKGASDTQVFNTLADNWSNGWYYGIEPKG